MKRKIIASIIAAFVLFSGVAAAATVKWNGYTAFQIFIGSSEVKTAEPAIIIKDKTFIPASALKAMGIGVTAGNGRVTITPPKPIEKPAIKLDQVTQIMKSVFMVYGYKPDGSGRTQGSGFVIDGNILITNYHVAGASNQIEIIVDGQTVQKTAADVLFKDEKVDIMGIRLDGQNPIPFTEELPALSDNVYAIGFPDGAFKMSQGILLSIGDIDGVKNTLIHNAKTDHGSSGGILFNAKGEAVGLTSWVSNTGNAGGAIPMSYIKTEIDKLK
ncbi:serine protease [Cohnella sp. AR92]|uniref:S1 family peptidase n=1 Tax=Cohnella sp. AR92 TaxID=648716 RepID=UPI000F8E41B8|nr:serine protease [Cohnella sp. AR92]RUS42265.1 serine protease [Cohnella sp. AR92]